MKKLVLLLCATLIAAFTLASCGSSASFKMEDGVLSPAGKYTIEATLEGGSGKATIQSPVEIEVTDSGMTATIVWSSSNYDLMVVDGAEYKPVSTEKGSTFKIPVKQLDSPLSVKAETIAMSTPHMIEYTITFDPIHVKPVK